MGLLSARPSSAPFVVEDPCFLDTQENPDWQRQFGNSNPLKLELGFGTGDFLVAMAGREPAGNFIGIDFSQAGIQKLLGQIQTFQIKNIRVVFGDIREKLPALFKDEEVETIYINLPDPWPKKRHSKRRLVKPELVNQISQKLSPLGKVYLATDSQSYAGEMLEYLNDESSLQNINGEAGIVNDRTHLPKTRYEKSFLYAGDTIHYLEYLKKDGNAKPSLKEKNKTPDLSGLSKDESLTVKFKNAEARAKDACDFKRVADGLAEAGDMEWARNVYMKAEEKAEDSLDLNWLAYSVALALKENDRAVKIYKEAETRAESSLDLNWLAYSIFEALGDRDWAKNLFKKAESKPENIRELCDLAESVSEILNDKQWQLKIYKKAAANAKDYSELIELADSIFAGTGDEKWARDLYHKAEEKAVDCCDLIGLAESFMEKLGDGEGARRIYKKAETRAEDSLDFVCIAESLVETLGDREWASLAMKKA